MPDPNPFVEIEIDYDDPSEQQTQDEAFDGAAVGRGLSAESLQRVQDAAEQASQSGGVADQLIESRTLESTQDGTYPVSQLDEGASRRSSEVEQMEQEAIETQSQIAAQSRSGRERVRRRFNQWVVPSVTGTVGGVIGSIVGAVITYFMSSKDEPDPFDKELSSHVKELIIGWREQSNEEFWGSMADYVSKSNPPLQELFLFATYTMRLTTKVKWNDGWDDWVDRTVRDLVKESPNGRNMKDFYLAVGKLEPPEPAAWVNATGAVPKYVGAYLCSLSLPQIIKIVQSSR
jgi:hypothetical protein